MHNMQKLESIISNHSQAGSNWTPFSISIVAIEYANHLNRWRGMDEPPELEQEVVLKKEMDVFDVCYWDESKAEYVRKFTTGWQWKPLTESGA